jgi:hypothetical protein
MRRKNRKRRADERAGRWQDESLRVRALFVARARRTHRRNDPSFRKEEFRRVRLTSFRFCSTFNCFIYSGRRGSIVKLNKSGIVACALYLAAVIWLIASRYSGAHSSAIDATQFYLVRYPLAFLGLNYFGPEAFWTKYELFFFPVCLVVFYFLGCAVGWVLGFGNPSVSRNDKPPDTA